MMRQHQQQLVLSMEVFPVFKNGTQGHYTAVTSKKSKETARSGDKSERQSPDWVN